MLGALGVTGWRTPWYSFRMRFRRISYPILPGCREAPTTAIDRGEKMASRPAPIIFAAKLPGGIEPSRGAWRCIITLGNRALRLIYRDENRGITAPRSDAFRARFPW